MICFKLPEKGVGFCQQPNNEFIAHNLFPVEISSGLFWMRIFFGFALLFVFAWKVRRSLADAVIAVWLVFCLFGISSWMSSLILINSLFLSTLPSFLAVLASLSAGVLLPFQALFSLLAAWVLKAENMKILALTFLACLAGSILSSEEVKVIQAVSNGIVRELRPDKSFFDFAQILDLRYLIRRPVFILGFVSLLLVQDWKKLKEQWLYILSLFGLTVALGAKSFVAIPLCYLTLLLIAFDKFDNLERKMAKAISVMFYLERIFNIDSVANLFLPLSGVARIFGSLSICHLLVILILLNLKLGSRLGLYMLALVLSFSIDRSIFS